MNLILKAPFNVTSGYGKIIDFFLKYTDLIKDLDVKCISLHGIPDKKYKKYIVPITKDFFNSSKELIIFPISIINCNRNFLLDLCKKRIIYTMYETTRFNDHIANEFNEVSSVIVPCKWNKDNFIINGVISPIHVIPLGINTNIFKYEHPRNKDIFVFGCGNNDYRKRLKDIIRCFARAFHPKIKDVKLKIKISEEEVGSFSKYMDKRIEFNYKYLSEYELAEWYYNIDLFVSVSYAEGWGLMQHESMSCGRPLISPHYGGVTEFFDDSVGYSIKYKEIMADGPYIHSGGFWADFDEDDLIEKMRWCYNNREDVYKKGTLSSERVKELTEENMIKKIYEIIKNV